MGRKIRLGVLCGGRSAEHEVSVISARSMLEAIDKDKYELVMIGISKEGRWLSAADTQQLLASSQVEEDGLTPVALDYLGTRTLVAQQGDRQDQPLDVIFPLLHGPYGEDGTVQGLMELANVAYVGAGVVGSAVGMDKEMMKRVFKAEGLPQVDYQVVRRSRWEKDRAGMRAEIEAALDYPRLRQAGEPRFERRGEQSLRWCRTGTGHRRSSTIRLQDRSRGRSERLPRSRSGDLGQRVARSVHHRRDRAGQ